jgi:hypothetical protein
VGEAATDGGAGAQTGSTAAAGQPASSSPSDPFGGYGFGVSGSSIIGGLGGVPGESWSAGAPGGEPGPAQGGGASAGTATTGSMPSAEDAARSVADMMGQPIMMAPPPPAGMAQAMLPEGWTLDSSQSGTFARSDTGDLYEWNNNTMNWDFRAHVTG